MSTSMWYDGDSPYSNKHNAQMLAVHELWTKASEELVLRHPDPVAKVTLEFERPGVGYGKVYGRFNIRNAPDSNDPERRLQDTFRMNISVASWPGKRAAQLWIVGAWTQYVMHEVSELVSYKAKLPAAGTRAPYPDNSRVIDMHRGAQAEPLSRKHWRDMETIQHSDGDWLLHGLGLVIGKEATADFLEMSKPEALKELEEAKARHLAEIEGRELGKSIKDRKGIQ